MEDEIRLIPIPKRKTLKKSRFVKKMEKLEKAEKKLKAVEKVYTDTYVSYFPPLT